MRKVDPVDLCVQVQGQLTGMRAFYDSGWQAFQGQPHTAARQSTLSELVFHRAYVEVESFLSAYFIGCINRDAATFVAFRRNQIETSVEAKFPGTTVNYLDFAPPQHLTVAAVSGLVDGSEQNLTFGDFAKMADRAQQWLAPQWSQKINGVAVDRRQIMNTAKAVRNCIAHQSKASFDSMNAALLALPAHGVCGQLRREANAVNNVGAYLKALRNGTSRTTIFIEEFRGLAESLK